MKEPNQGGMDHAELAPPETMKGGRLDCSRCETQQDNSAEITLCRLRALFPKGVQDSQDLEERENFGLFFLKTNKQKRFVMGCSVEGT